MREVEELIGRLDSKDFLERTHAVLELGKIGAAAVGAVPALIRLISLEESREANRKIDYENPLERGSFGLAARGAVKALSQIGKPAVPALISALDHRDAMVRTAAAEALGLIGTSAKDALAALVITAQHDADKLVRMAAAHSLEQIQKKWWQFWKS